MPRLSVWFIRAALVYLALGFTFGALMLANKGVPLFPQLWRLYPVHIEFLLVGWTLQLAMGVAFWILPRLEREPKRGNPMLAWSALILINLGVLLISASGWLAAPAWLNLAGRLSEGLAVAAFALQSWPRVKPFG